MKGIRIEVDLEVDAAYIGLSDAAVARTVELSDQVLVDLDEFGVAVGIEVLDRSVPLPLSELVERYHVRSEVVDLLGLLRPGVSSFFELTRGTDGSSAGDRTPRWVEA